MKIDTEECHVKVYERSGDVDGDFYYKDLGKLPEEKSSFKVVMLSRDFFFRVLNLIPNQENVRSV